MKKWVKIVGWSLFGVLVITVLFYAQKIQAETVIEQPDIVIHVNGENAFLTEDELLLRLKSKGLIFNGQAQEQLNVSAIEKFIASMTEVKNVKVFSQLGSQWKIDVDVRTPIARVFNKSGETFYLDEEGFIMKASNLHTARVVVVTGEIKDRINAENVQGIINNDSLKSIRKLDDVYRISNYVCNDPFLRSLISQIHLKKNGDFVLIPIVGGQKIVFGTANTSREVGDKFKKLKIFYQEAIPYEGWGKYEEISLKYKKQIVCKTAQGYKEVN